MLLSLSGCGSSGSGQTSGDATGLGGGGSSGAAGGVRSGGGASGAAGVVGTDARRRLE